jgi:putative membrane protein
MFEYYEWFRAIHLIAVIFWMAGLLYLPRLYVYHSTAKLGGELDTTLKIQERRLLKIIMNPSMIVAFIFGIILIGLRADVFSTSAWLYVKLLGVFVLIGFHGMLSADRKKFEAGERPRSEKFYRLINEVPPIIAIVVVIMAVVEPF